MNLHQSFTCSLIHTLFCLMVENQTAKMALIILFQFIFHALQHLKSDLSRPLTLQMMTPELMGDQLSRMIPASTADAPVSEQLQKSRCMPEVTEVPIHEHIEQQLILRLLGPGFEALVASLTSSSEYLQGISSSISLM